MRLVSCWLSLNDQMVYTCIFSLQNLAVLHECHIKPSSRAKSFCSKHITPAAAKVHCLHHHPCHHPCLCLYLCENRHCSAQTLSAMHCPVQHRDWRGALQGSVN